MLRIDERGDPALGLGLRNDLECERGLARGFRAIDLDATAPLGTPPIPKAASRASEPVGIAATWSVAAFSPSFMSEPLPNFFSICSLVTSRIFSFFGPCLTRSYPDDGRPFGATTTLHEQVFGVNECAPPMEASYLRCLAGHESELCESLVDRPRGVNVLEKSVAERTDIAGSSAMPQSVAADCRVPGAKARGRLVRTSVRCGTNARDSGLSPLSTATPSASDAREAHRPEGSSATAQIIEARPRLGTARSPPKLSANGLCSAAADAKSDEIR